MRRLINNNRRFLIALIIEIEKGKKVNVNDFLRSLKVYVSLPTLNRIHNDLKIFYQHKIVNRKLIFHKWKIDKKKTEVIKNGSKRKSKNRRNKVCRKSNNDSKSCS